MLSSWGWLAGCFATAEATKYFRGATAVETFTVELERDATDILVHVGCPTEPDAGAAAYLSVRIWSAVARCGDDSPPIELVPIGGDALGDDHFVGTPSSRRSWVAPFRVEGLPPERCVVDLEVFALVDFDKNSDPLGVELEVLAVGGVAP